VRTVLAGRRTRVELVGIDVTDADSDLARLLDRRESGRLQTLRRIEDQQLFVAAHGLTRQIIGAWLGLAPEAVEIQVGCRTCAGTDHGKPYVEGGPQFSYAHAGTRVLLAVSAQASVGVDLETVGSADFPGFDAIALSPVERSWAGWNSAARVRTWTRKEAALKAWGHGLDVDPSELEVSAPDQPPRLISIPPRGDRGIHLVDLEWPGYLGALAVVTDDEPDPIIDVQAVRSYGVFSPASTAIGNRFPVGGSGQVARSV
jgi:4'-phosphopantetheinyl transferase